MKVNNSGSMSKEKKLAKPTKPSKPKKSKKWAQQS